MNISPARTAAFDILKRIESDRAYSSVLLPMYENHLSPLDRGLCHQITLGVLRCQMYLDRAIDLLVAGKKLDLAVRIALRIALYQLEFLDKIPSYSAVSESVNLVQWAKKTSAKGFVNAILRKFLKQKPQLNFADDVDRISITTSHPRWLIEKWTADLGMEQAITVANANNEIHASSFRVLDPTSEVEALIADSESSAFAEGCYRLSTSDRRAADLAARGAIYIQDEASQIAAQTVTVPDFGRFLDTCAAPGGKTGQIARRFRETGATVVAGDLHPSRIEHLRENCRNQSVDSVRIVQYDAACGLPFADESFDAVLVDAPCSGTGTIRHNPELRYFLAPADIAELSLKQLAILSNASKVVRPGGSLIYSTCSLEPEEGEQVCRQFLRMHDSYESIVPNVDERLVTSDGFARTWPDRDAMDGFFIAAFRRR